MRLSPRRGFLFTDGDPADAVERVRAAGVLAYDATGASPGWRSRASRSCAADRPRPRADPDGRPFAHVTALFRRGADGWFHVYVQQELGHYVAEAVLDALAGLEEQR